MFQSTHSRGVRQLGHTLMSFFIRFQSTHSRGVRLYIALVTTQAQYVSIHALTRSATSNVPATYILSQCFNPRTHEECDRHAVWSVQRDASFNPRTHEECDRTYFVELKTTGKFQSTHSRGVRHMERYRTQINGGVSIHALTRSATQPCDDTGLNGCFNPRTHEECDVAVTRSAITLAVSIHALTRSATIFNLLITYREMFQSTHSRGVRLDSLSIPSLI